MDEKKIESKRTYTMELIEYEDGTSLLNRTNDGFNALEIIGLLNQTILDINQQFKGMIKPDVIKRTVITD